VHVRAQDHEAKVWLHDLAVAINLGFSAHELNGIIRHLRVHRDALMDAWNEHFGN
jgi:hypothetical protein